jgi:hypothetical protein
MDARRLYPRDGRGRTVTGQKLGVPLRAVALDRDDAGPANDVEESLGSGPESL